MALVLSHQASFWSTSALRVYHHSSCGACNSWHARRQWAWRYHLSSCSTADLHTSAIDFPASFARIVAIRCCSSICWRGFIATIVKPGTGWVGAGCCCQWTPARRGCHCATPTLYCLLWVYGQRRDRVISSVEFLGHSIHIHKHRIIGNFSWKAPAHMYANT